MQSPLALLLQKVTFEGLTVHGAIRRFLFLYIFFVILGQQGTFFLVAIFHLDFDPDWMVWVMPAILPLSLTAWRLLADKEPLARYALRPWPLWALLSCVLFGFWAFGYFLVGKLTDPSRALLLPPEVERFDRFIPFEPYFVFLYLTVYPLFLLPYFCAKSTSTIIRLSIGYFAMLLVSYTVFLLVPVAFPRPTLPETWSSYSVWVLQIVYGQDPPWNCLPSTHCGVALMAALAILESHRRLGIWALVTAISIAISTVFTKQHYIVDVIAGFTVAGITYWVLLWIWRNPVKLVEETRRFLSQKPFGTRKS